MFSVSQAYKTTLPFMFYIFLDECQTKYGNANAWRYCTKVFDMLTVAAVSPFIVLSYCLHTYCRMCNDIMDFFTPKAMIWRSKATIPDNRIHFSSLCLRLRLLTNISQFIQVALQYLNLPFLSPKGQQLLT